MRVTNDEFEYIVGRLKIGRVNIPGEVLNGHFYTVYNDEHWDAYDAGFEVRPKENE